jgi:3-isopropylmalate dehydrogenase
MKFEHRASGAGHRMADAIPGLIRRPAAVPLVVGVLEGEGVGPELVPLALGLLETLAAYAGKPLDVRHGGLIGYPAKERFGSSLSPEVIRFAEDTFDDGGTLFCGPGGERFVYELRRRFDLFCKFTPIQPFPELSDAGVVRPEVSGRADIVAVRENSAGIYQGEWTSTVDEHGEAVASHSFEYSANNVRRILQTAFRLAETRRKRLHVVLKPGGIPSVSALWRSVAQEVGRDHGVELFEQEIDNAVYQLIADPGQFDVIVSPNLFGDVLADCGSLLLASRGLSFSGNFNAAGNAVYQTGHGAARDIAGRGIANPIGQILSLGMMLRESFDWPEADEALRSAIRTTLEQGLRTVDIAGEGHQVVGVTAFGERVRENLITHLGALPP